jgi:hypothetical protein
MVKKRDRRNDVHLSNGSGSGKRGYAIFSHRGYRQESNRRYLAYQPRQNHFHYIKTTRLFGAQIRYLVYGDGALPGTLDCIRSTNGMARQHWATRDDKVKRGKRLLAALGFASASWRLSSREEFIGWPNVQREANLKFVLNNARFLILPRNRIKSLASKSQPVQEN